MIIPRPTIEQLMYPPKKKTKEERQEELTMIEKFVKEKDVKATPMRIPKVRLFGTGNMKRTR